MEASELLKKVQQVEIATRGLSDRIFAGEYKSAFKGAAWPSARTVNTRPATKSEPSIGT